MAAQIASLAMIFAPVLGYIPQYFQIKRTNNAEGFSTLVSFILIVSNLIRIFFWIGKQFEITLLYQAIVMIIAQNILLELCIRVRNSTKPTFERRLGAGSIFSAPIRKFWAWDDYLDYGIFLIFLTVSLALLSIMFIHQDWFVELMGVLALGIESMLGLPQLIRNYQKKSTEGLSVELIVSWFIGDGLKTIYFVFTGAPPQFIFCGATQLFVDILISLQIMTFVHSHHL